MPGKVSLPAVTSLGTEGMSFGTIVFMQAVHDGLKAVDDNAIYKDSINVAPHTPRIRAKSASGQVVSISGVNVASGNDFAVAVNDSALLIQSHLELSQKFNALLEQLKGT